MEKHIAVGKSKLKLSFKKRVPAALTYQEIWGQQKQRLYQQAMGVSKKEDKQKLVLFLDIASSETVFSRPWSG